MDRDTLRKALAHATDLAHYEDQPIVNDAASMLEKLLPDKCGNCDGGGTILQVTLDMRIGDKAKEVPCPVCHGSGETWNEELVEAATWAFLTAKDQSITGRYVSSSQGRVFVEVILTAILDFLTEKAES